jgi:hypothetical protein
VRGRSVEYQDDDVNIHSVGKDNRSFAVAAKQLVINQETYLNDLKRDVTPVKLQETEHGKTFTPIEASTPRGHNRGKS